MNLRGRIVDKDSLEVDGVDKTDFPDFVDSFFSCGRYADGTELSDHDLDKLTEKYSEEIWQMAYERAVMYE